MVEVQLEPELEERLERLAAETQVTKSFFAREAIERFIEDSGWHPLALGVEIQNFAGGDGATFECGGLNITRLRSGRFSISISQFGSESWHS